MNRIFSETQFKDRVIAIKFEVFLLQQTHLVEHLCNTLEIPVGTIEKLDIEKSHTGRWKEKSKVEREILNDRLEWWITYWNYDD